MIPGSRKRPADPTWRELAPAAPKVPRFSQPTRPISNAHPQPAPAYPYGSSRSNLNPNLPSQVVPPKGGIFKPTIRHGPHPDSKLCQNFHWVPYPLGLLPYDSWKKLHSPDNKNSPSPFVCPVCRAPRTATAHTRKLFLVAERLTWEDGLVSSHERDRNEQLTWEANYELGILDPCVEDPEQVPGGKKSQANRWHPYQNEFEMTQAFNLIFITETITELTWSLWIGAQKSLQKLLAADDETPQSKTRDMGPVQTSGNRDLAVSLDDAIPRNTAGAFVPTFGQPAPPSSFSNYVNNERSKFTTHGVMVSSTQLAASSAPGMVAGPESQDRSKSETITSYNTLQDFYSLLDEIERTSPVGALFLAAYAEHLRADKCRDCWLKHNIDLDAH